MDSEFSVKEILTQFKKHNWQFKKNNRNRCSFHKKGHPSQFVIEQLQNSTLRVSMPIPNSEEMFSTHYSALEEQIATAGLIKHLHNYESRNYINPIPLPTASEELPWI